MTPVQFRMARTALGLKIEDVAMESPLSATTIHRMEQDKEGPIKQRNTSRVKLTEYYTSKGILFVEGRAYGVLIIPLEHNGSKE